MARQSERDPYIDFLRTGSLLIVVIWHWLFNVVNWRSDGPHFGNPIGSTLGLWALTWLFQVLPVFFFVGGFANLTSWESVERRGGGYLQYAAKRMRRLLPPVALCLAAAGVVWLLVSILLPEVHWVGRALYLLLSPLWFLGIYLVLVLITPAAARLHQAGDRMVPAVMVVLAAVVDVVRFRTDFEELGWLNLLLVWGLAHQLGFFWKRLTAVPGQAASLLAIAGLTGLILLTGIGPYPRSMVGVPGQRVSNMAPPTLCIATITFLQIGVVLLLRQPVTAWLRRSGPKRFMEWAGARAMTIYLWHFPGFAIAYALVSLLGVAVPERPTPEWWSQRPLWAILPALCTIPLVRFFRRFEERSRAA